jgi:condensin complex subunit 1
MALRIVDEDARICDLARLFFHEVAAKNGNMVYNTLPDIISRLLGEWYAPESARPDEDFDTIVTYLFKFIDKDKQASCRLPALACNVYMHCAWHATYICIAPDMQRTTLRLTCNGRRCA